MSWQVLALLSSVGGFKMTEAYTGRFIGDQDNIDGLQLDRVAEVRFRANERPEVYYETDAARKWLAEQKKDEREE